MRVINAQKLKNTVAGLCIQGNFVLRRDVLRLLKSAGKKETKKIAKNAIGAIIKNARIAEREGLAICQDTGMPVVFVEMGQGVRVAGDFVKAINKGVESGYKKAFLRNSIIKDPLSRGSPGYAPALIHTHIVKGDKLKITVLPKGFGCENKSALKMFNPTAGIKEIKKFIVDALRCAGADACPPYIVGVGIGGTADYACLLAKKALLKNIKNQKSNIKMTYQNSKIKKLEKDLLREINQLNIGPMGFGGKATALAVNIETYPTHIAGLPVAVNISCHALRSATSTL